MAVASAKMVSEIRANLFAHLQNLSLRFHYKSKSGDLITRFTYDVNRLRDVTSMALIPLIANLFTVVGMVAIMFWFNAQLTLIILAVIPVFFFSTIRFSTKIKHVVQEQRKRDGAVAAAAAESIGAIKIVQAMSLNKIFEKSFAKQNNKSLKKGAQAQRLAALLEQNIELLLAVATALILWRGVQLVLDGELTAGTLLVFISYLAQTFRPMRQTAKYLAQISKALASGDRIGDILDTLPNIRDKENAVTLENTVGTITFDNVSFRYNKRGSTLTNININIRAGERVAVVGPSGAGKSTILSLLLRLYDPKQGRILLDNNDLKDIKLDSLRNQMSVVLQDSILFAVSIRDNIAYGRMDAGREDIEACARLANAHDFICALPNGYDTVVGERGTTLSGGQRQRIALARAVIRNSPILVLDEPTTGLDKTNEGEVLQALDQCSKGKTTILVSHNLHAAQNFDSIYYIENGIVAEYGTHHELLNARGPYWHLYTQQAFKFKKHLNSGNKQNIVFAGVNT